MRRLCRLGRLRAARRAWFPDLPAAHWAFAGTGLYYGDLLGADSHIYGYEVDGLDFEIRYGLPYPTADQRRA
jgi:hypothetical protein